MNVRRLRRISPAHRAAIIALDRVWLTGGKAPRDADFDSPRQAWWGAFDDAGRLVGFASAAARADGSVMLTRAVVDSCARGAGLQRRLISARVRWARSLGATRVWTYTCRENPKSAANLNRCGFHYRGCDETGRWLYWRLPLSG